MIYDVIYIYIYLLFPDVFELGASVLQLNCYRMDQINSHNVIRL